jgi:hypothetical protein
MKFYDKNGSEYNIDNNKEIARGGEGAIIEYNAVQVAKIYLPNILPISEIKFKELYDLQTNLFIKPETLLYNKKKNVVGFLMNIVDHTHYPLYSLFNNGFCQRNNIGFTDELKIAEKLIDGTLYAHKKDIIIGDLNPFNLLVNNVLSTFFIDVDSYQTPSEKHSGRLLDDIRDYLYHGSISKESDYFALAVIIFNLLTKIHPYKGVHSKYQGLAERMIHKLPILINDPKLIIPKCYKPLNDKYLNEQFEKIFIKGERFPISLNKNINVIVTKKKQTVIKTDKLMINEILMNNDIISITNSNKYCCVKTKTNLIIYDTSLKGYIKKLYELNSDYDAYFPTDENIILKKDNELYFIKDKNKGTIEKIENIKFDKLLYLNQYKNVLLAIQDNISYKIYLNDILNNNIKFELFNIYGKSMKKIEGLVQNISGNYYAFNESNNKLNHIHIPYSLKDIYQVNNVGVIQYFENDSIKHKLFNIKGLVPSFSDEINGFRYIGNKENAFIIVPEDNFIKILRIEDFSEIVNFECPISSTDSQCFNTISGILMLSDNNLYLINTK